MYKYNLCGRRGVANWEYDVLNHVGGLPQLPIQSQRLSGRSQVLANSSFDCRVVPLHRAARFYRGGLIELWFMEAHGVRSSGGDVTDGCLTPAASAGIACHGQSIPISIDPVQVGLHRSRTCGTSHSTVRRREAITFNGQRTRSHFFLRNLTVPTGRLRGEQRGLIQDVALG